MTSERQGLNPGAEESFGKALSCRKNGPVAQLVEHETFNLGVVGSNPTGLTFDRKHISVQKSQKAGSTAGERAEEPDERITCRDHRRLPA